MGNNLKYQEIIWDAWSELKHVLKNGETDQSLQERIFKDSSFSAEYIRGMKNIARKPAAQIADLVPTEGTGSFLDVGAGPGVYSLAFLEKNPHLSAYLLDLAPTIEIAREEMRFHPDRDRVHFVEGNYHDKDFGKDRFEVVLMSHITHDEGAVENKELIRKAFTALKKGGKLIIHDFMVNDQKTAPLFSALFSVHMLVYTRAGRVYSINEYTSWLREAGFIDIQKHDICQESASASIALVAIRPLS
jgi:ubiquinone/menaquinone biosynthesis C-methylase UbiE